MSAPTPSAEAGALRHRTVATLLFVLRIVAAAVVLFPLLASPSIASIALAGAISVLFAGSILRWVFLLLIAEPAAVTPKPGIRVAAVTTFVPSAETLTMVERTLRAMTSMAYPHDTWLLDEGNDERAIRLCEQVGVRHWSRRNRAEYQTATGRFQTETKHGNYNGWLSDIGFEHYDVLAAFDPDHVPEPGFLIETLGQLAPGIAYVQSPQEYYNLDASLIAHGCSEETRDFYWITQRAYHRIGAPSVIGSHGVHDLRALSEFGGLAAHVADDLLLTLKYQMSQWRGAYVPKVLARGLAPVDWPTYVKQQRRWARALFDIKLRLYPSMTSHLPPHARIVGLLQGLSYLQDAVVAVCCAVAVCAILIWGVPMTLTSAFRLPEFIAALGILVATGLYPHWYHGPHRNFRFYWRAGLLRAVKWPYALLALADVVRGRDLGYELTAKHDAPERRDWRLYWPHVVTCAIILAVWAVGASLDADEDEDVLPTALAAIVLLPSVLVLVSGFFRAPAAFDPAVADEASDGRK